ncbi:MAG: hypothetical protein KDD92_05265, partial [Caldilineaceae bacterium]|nr:hypothetical protein [Caldilineaceae bacterium]
GDLRLGQGRENAKTFLAENSEIAAEIDGLIRQEFGLIVNLEPKADAKETAADANEAEDQDEKEETKAAA